MSIMTSLKRFRTIQVLGRPDEPVEPVEEVFAVGVRTRTVGTGADAELHLLADVPVLAVREIPEGDGVVGAEGGAGDGVGMEMPLADDLGAIHGSGPEGVGHHVVGMETEEQIGKDRVVVDAAVFLGGQAGEAGRSAGR